MLYLCVSVYVGGRAEREREREGEIQVILFGKTSLSCYVHSNYDHYHELWFSHLQA